MSSTEKSNKLSFKPEMSTLQLSKSVKQDALQVLFNVMTSKTGAFVRAWPGSDAEQRKVAAARMIGLVMQCAQSKPRLLECTLGSLLGAIVQSAQLGLYPDDVRALSHLVPFSVRNRGTVVQFIIGYRGYIELIRRAGQIRQTTPAVVRAGDFFSYADFPRKMRHIRYEMAGFDDEANSYVSRRLKDISDPDQMVAAYTVFEHVDGHQDFSTPMSRKQIEKIRDGSRGIKRQDGSKNLDSPWYTHEESMWLKTAIRHGVKYVALSTEDKSLELMGQVANDERVISGFVDNEKTAGPIYSEDDILSTGESVPEVGQAPTAESAPEPGAGAPDPVQDSANSEPETEQPKSAMDDFVDQQKPSAPTPPLASSPPPPAPAPAPAAVQGSGPEPEPEPSKPTSDAPTRQRVARRPTNK